MAPNIAPIFREILESNSFLGIKNVNQEIIKANKDPPNNFKKR